MDHAEALELLSSPIADDRLRAARCLCRTATKVDIPVLEAALGGETQRWIKGALTKALRTLRGESQPAIIEISPENKEERMIDQIYAEAVEDTTHRLVHEISAIIGRLDVHAAGEFPNWQNSKTKIEWSRLRDLIRAIDRLSKAASAPDFSEFNLVEVLESVVASESSDPKKQIQYAGPKPLIVFGASELIQLIVANALRNALESLVGFRPDDPVVLTWGETEKDYWIAVLDRGRGLPETSPNVFEIGATTKRGHLGMGLALARQAAISVNGAITLNPRRDGGTRFEFRWPKTTV